MTTTITLKHYFGVVLAERLAALITPHYPDFPVATFIAAVADKTGPLELKRRVAIIPNNCRELCLRAIPTSGSNRTRMRNTHGLGLLAMG